MEQSVLIVVKRFHYAAHMASGLALIDSSWQVPVLQQVVATGVVQLLHAHLATQAFERFAVAGLDDRGRLHSFAEQRGGAVELGGVLAAVRAALAPPAVTKLVLAHNHPCQSLGVSRADRETTRRVAALARLAGVELTDHLIFAGDQIVSFRALGLIGGGPTKAEFGACQPVCGFL